MEERDLLTELAVDLNIGKIAYRCQKLGACDGLMLLHVPNIEDARLTFSYKKGVSMGYPYYMEMFDHDMQGVKVVTVKEAVEYSRKAV